MIFGLSSIISFVVLFYVKQETSKALNNYKSDALDHIKGYISSLDENLVAIENEIYSQYKDKLSLVQEDIESYENLTEISADQLRSIAQKYAIEHIYLIDKTGVIFQTTYDNDLNLNLFNVSSEIENFLTETYGKGIPFTHRALISQYNQFNKFIYYSPKNSSYIIEISVNLRSYIRNKYSDSYLHYLFNDVIKNYILGNNFLTELDVFDITNNVNWSILRTNNKFNGGESFIASIDPDEGLTIKDNGKIKFYYIVHDSKKTGIYYGKDLLIEAVFDFSELQSFSHSIVLFSILSLLLMGIIISILDSKYIHTYYIKRILRINSHLNLLEQGIYPDNLLFSEKDELSEIAENMNKMKDKIMDREVQLRNKLIELEKATTALKESRERIEYDKLKNEFFANISHEFKTPLNILLSSLQLLDLYVKNGTISDESNKLKHYMKGMRQNSYRLLRLISNLIDITKIDASFFNIDTHNQDIVSLVEDIVLSTGEYAAFKHLTLNFSKGSNSIITACDSNLIERILLNLLSNAIKFTPEGGHIDVSLFEKHNSILITVKDDGIGIPPDKHQLIFERFRQVDKSFTRNAEGSGIGLSLVKALVEMHKGSIFVKSEYGKGSEFTVILPIVVLDEKSESESPILFHDSKIEKMNVEFSDIYS
jgi:signal transduction histidine kinase